MLGFERQRIELQCCQATQVLKIKYGLQIIRKSLYSAVIKVMNKFVSQ